MPKNLSNVNNFDTPVVVPIDADARDAASVETALQNLTNRTFNNKFRLDSDRKLNTSAGFNVPIFGGTTSVSGAGDDPAWIPDTNGTEIFLVNKVDSVAAFVAYDLTHMLPELATLTLVTVYVEGSAGVNGAHSADVAGLPGWTLTRVTPDGQTTNSVASGADTSANFTAYDLPHTIGSGALTHVIVPVDRYVLKMFSEFGANSQSLSLGLHGITLDWTVA